MKVAKSQKKREGVPEDVVLKALADLDDTIEKAESSSDDDSDSDDASEDESESVSMKSKKSFAKGMPKTNKQATVPIEEGGEGEEADVETTAGKKSFRSEVLANGNVRKAYDASPFLEGLVDGVAQEVDSFRKALLYVQEHQDDHNGRVSKALVAMGNHMVEKFEEISSRLDAIGARPVAVRKSVINKSEVNERFEKSGGDEFEFTREQVLEKAVQMVEQGKLLPIHVANYESNGVMEASIAKSITAELRREAALS